jgi:hypothetical protein
MIIFIQSITILAYEISALQALLVLAVVPGPALVLRTKLRPGFSVLLAPPGRKHLNGHFLIGTAKNRRTYGTMPRTIGSDPKDVAQGGFL